jgi:hypothetical protein
MFALCVALSLGLVAAVCLGSRPCACCRGEDRGRPTQFGRVDHRRVFRVDSQGDRLYIFRNDRDNLEWRDEWKSEANGKARDGHAEDSSI